MKVKDLEGNVTVWRPAGNIVGVNDTRKRSQLHLDARKLLYELFPTIPIMEEVPIKPRPNQNQYIDFYLHKLKLAIEVHGQQHFKFSSLYHVNAHGFLRQRKLDMDKEAWCMTNGITYIQLPFDESVEEWKKRIVNR